MRLAIDENASRTAITPIRTNSPSAITPTTSVGVPSRLSTEPAASAIWPRLLKVAYSTTTASRR